MLSAYTVLTIVLTPDKLPDMPTTGPQLRKERRAAEVSVTRIAAHLGLSRQTVHAIERDAEPDPERIVAYRDALKTLRAGTVAAPEPVA